MSDKQDFVVVSSKREAIIYCPEHKEFFSEADTEGTWLCWKCYFEFFHCADDGAKYPEVINERS